MSGPTKRLKQCPVCRQRVGFKLDERDGEIKLATHNVPGQLNPIMCRGSLRQVKQR